MSDEQQYEPPRTPADDGAPSLVVPGELAPERTRRTERHVALLFCLAGSLGVAFCVIYALGANTQLLALALGGALLALASALLLAAARVVVRENAVEPRPKLAEPTAERRASGELGSGARGISRRRLLSGAAGAAGVGVGAAVIAPLASLGPSVADILSSAPWRRGTVLVDEQGTPIVAEEIVTRSFTTAFPEDADPRELGSPVIVLRLDPSTLKLPRGRAGWAPEGLLAYSKICTHAGCAVSLYRTPLNQPTSHLGAALVCPCHYSTFDVARGAAVEFGPAARPLPQLPLLIRADRVLVAAGGFSGPVGPSWWGVRRSGRTRYAS